MALYIFSDAHLGSGSPEKEDEKYNNIRLLFDKVKADGDRLVILGDLFDFWFEYKYAIPKEYHQMLFMLSELIQMGIKVDYIGGNHDFWMGDFFETQMGLDIHRDHLNIEYDNLRLHLIHGDGLASSDRGYRILKMIFRNRFNIWLYRMLPTDWAIPLAKAVSSSSRERSARLEHTFSHDYEDYAEMKLNDGYDIVAIGHIHLPIYKEFNSGVYINSGDFIHHFSYAKLDNGKITLEYIK